MCYSENASDPATSRFREREFEQLRASAPPAELRIDCERADFRKVSAVVFESHASYHSFLFFMYEEVAYVSLDFIFGSRQKQSLLGISGDQFKNRPRV
jgi:hypothetical protein